MSENTLIAVEFPHIGFANYRKGGALTVEHKRHVEACFANFIPHVDELVCLKTFEIAHFSISRASLRNASRMHILTRARKWAWTLCYRHPACRASYPMIAKEYARDYATVRTQVRLFEEQIQDGHIPKDLSALNWICRELELRGFQPFRIEAGQ